MVNKKKPEVKEMKLRLVWGSPDDLPTIFANHLQVSHAGGNEFFVFFGNATPPLMHGLTEDELNELPDKITIDPVAKIVVTPETMRAFVDVLSDNMKSYDMNFGDKK